MSKAFKCDRCKKCFDPWETGDEKLEFGNISEYMTLTPVGSSFDFTYRDEDIHFCPECNKAFGLFMQNRSIDPEPAKEQNRNIDPEPAKEPKHTKYLVEMVSKNDPPVAFQFIRVFVMAENEKEAKTSAVETMRTLGLHAKAISAVEMDI